MEKLSDAKFLSALTMSEEDINNYVFQARRIDLEEGRSYDVGLVLGCSNYDIMEHRANDAIELYKEGILDTLVLTGGIGFFSKNREDSEASVMRKYMISNGVSDENIIVEDKSRNTFENMNNSVKMIEDASGKDGNIVIVTSDFHSKRSKGMLQKMTPLEILSYGSLDGKHDIDVWSKGDFAVKKLIRTEALLLAWYTQKQKMMDQPVESVRVRSR